MAMKDPKHISEIIPDALTDDQRKKMILISARSLGRQANLKSLETSFITGNIKENIPESVDAMAGGRNIHERLQDSLARIEMEMDAKSMEEVRRTEDSIVPKPKFGRLFYCGTGGQPEKLNEAKKLFENTAFNEEEYRRIINSSWTKT